MQSGSPPFGESNSVTQQGRSSGVWTVPWADKIPSNRTKKLTNRTRAMEMWHRLTDVREEVGGRTDERRCREQLKDICDSPWTHNAVVRPEGEESGHWVEGIRRRNRRHLY